MDEIPMAVLFDMDGVLIDTARYQGITPPGLLARFGFSDDDAVTAGKKANTMISFYNALQKIRPFDVSFDAFTDFMLDDLLKRIQDDGVTPDPELPIFLHHIREQGVEVAIGTSATRKSAARKLALVEMHNEFDIIVTADDVPNHKPHPDVYIEAAQRLGVDPRHCIVIDDSASGIEAGKSAGCKTIGFTKYLSDETALNNADETANSFAELSYDRLRALLNR